MLTVVMLIKSLVSDSASSGAKLLTRLCHNITFWEGKKSSSTFSFSFILLPWPLLLRVANGALMEGDDRGVDPGLSFCFLMLDVELLFTFEAGEFFLSLILLSTNWSALRFLSFKLNLSAGVEERRMLEIGLGALKKSNRGVDGFSSSSRSNEVDKENKAGFSAGFSRGLCSRTRSFSTLIA